MEKCGTSSPESKLLDLCETCASGYYPAENPSNVYSFVECYNDETKPDNFYFNSADSKYKPCYETCFNCTEGGTVFDNKCSSCALNHRPKPTKETDCVTLCTHFYYYTFYGQYKCSSGSSCPEEAPFYILDLGKCTDDCSKESLYKIQYGGQCLKECPSLYTHPSDDEKTCIDNEDDACIISKTEIDLEGTSLIETVNSNAKKYSEEFSYTSKHVSYLYDSEYSIFIYQENDCIESLPKDKTKMDFGDCYSKAQSSISYETEDKLIIALVERSNSQGQSTSIFYFYHPVTGEKIDVESICQDDKIIVKENILDQLNKTNINMETLKHLTDQGVDIFSLSGAFYTDICFHFESPNGKDVPLKDRILAFYPNISLCDNDCTSKGVNLTTMESICECTLGGILNNDLFTGNALFENTFGDVIDFIGNSNLDVMKCFSDVFNGKYFAKNTGGIIILIIMILEIGLSVLFLVFSIDKVTRYLYHLSEFFSSLIVIRNKQKKKKQEAKELRESLNNKSRVKLKISAFNDNTKKESNKNIIKKDKKGEIIETEYKFVKKSMKSLNNLDSNENKQVSQKSLDKLYKDKFQRKKFENNIMKDENKKAENLEKNKKNNVEIFQLIDENPTNKDLDNEIKKLQEKYNIDEEDFLKDDPDDMEYDDAIKYDKRTFYEYLQEKFMENQIIMNTFFNHDNLKPMTIKIMLLLLNIDLYFVVNGLFYSESYISDLFHSDEEETFFSFFPRSISRFFYTTIVGVIISSIIDCMFIEEKKVKRVFKREKENHVQVKYEISLIIKNTKKNYIIFLIVCFLITLISWYYVCCFNNVYPGVKVEWIKSSITIMIIMQLLSVLAGIIVALIRLISFKCKSEKLYKLKDFFN